MAEATVATAAAAGTPAVDYVARVAFITGITGQDGSYLAELLLRKDYVVYGLKRRHSYINTTRVDHLRGKVRMFYGDMNDAAKLAADHTGH